MHSCSAVVMDVVQGFTTNTNTAAGFHLWRRITESPDECRINAWTGIQVNLTPIPSYHWELKFPE